MTLSSLQLWTWLIFMSLFSLFFKHVIFEESMCIRAIMDIKAKTAKMYRKQINRGHLFVYDTLYVIPTFSNVDVKVKISFSFTFTIADFKLQTSKFSAKILKLVFTDRKYYVDFENEIVKFNLRTERFLI